MDSLTRNSIIISIILFVLLIFSIGWDRFGVRPRIWELNDVLEQDPVLTNYPYRFKVLQFLNGVATLTSPHANAVPIQPFLATIDPALGGKASTDQAMIAAAQRLTEAEMRAVELMTAEPDVDSVVWSLDRAWYHKHGIRLVQP